MERWFWVVVLFGMSIANLYRAVCDQELANLLLSIISAMMAVKWWIEPPDQADD